MPLSTTATRTPAPVAPPHAHSGVTSASATPVTSARSRASTVYAGSDCSATVSQHRDELRHLRVAGGVRASEDFQALVELAGRRDPGGGATVVAQRGSGDVGENPHQLEI